MTDDSTVAVGGPLDGTPMLRPNTSSMLPVPQFSRAGYCPVYVFDGGQWNFVYWEKANDHGVYRVYSDDLWMSSANFQVVEKREGSWISTVWWAISSVARSFRRWKN